MARPHASRSPRHGTVLIATLVCLLVVTSILGNLLLGAVRARRQLRAERDLQQTQLLLQAGIDRARYRLATEDDYRKETWSLPADPDTGFAAAQVTIETDARGTGTHVRVVAAYRHGSEQPISRSHSLMLPQSNPTHEEPAP